MPTDPSAKGGCAGDAVDVRAIAASPSNEQQPHWYVAGCLALLLIGLLIAAGPVLDLPSWHVDENVNPAFLEGMAWRDGRLTLPRRTPDTALYKDQVYSVHPPLFALLSWAATTLGPPQGVPEGVFYTPWYVMCVALPLPFVGFWAFYQVLRRAEEPPAQLTASPEARSADGPEVPSGMQPIPELEVRSAAQSAAWPAAWSAVLTAYWLLGTPMLPQLLGCRDGAINPLNHVLATGGLILLAGDLLGKQRIWPAAIGLVIAVWSRPNLVFFGLAILAVAWLSREQRGRRTAMAAAGLLLAVGVQMGLNWAKFDSPFDTGYSYIYDYRPGSCLAKRANTYGLFSPHFIPENAYCMNLAPPRFRLSPNLIQPEGSQEGASIWMTTPLLLGAFIGWRKWWQATAGRMLMLASVLVIGTFLMYHSHGASPLGFFAYGLDFLPVWLVVIAPWAVQRRWRAFTLACFGWSALYFHMIVWMVR